MSAQNNMLQKKDIVEFTNEFLLGHELHGFLQVGSSARGYAMETSDVDLMAFYNTNGELTSKPIHTVYKDVEVTLEHHDLHTFMLDSLDHRFNIKSLRQLHKIRDGIIHRADNHLGALIDIAKMAHLDKTVLLQALSDVAGTWHLISDTNVAYARHVLIKWAELLATLDLMTRPNTVAYSKPKWLYTNLRQAELQTAVALLDLLYVTTDEHIGKMRAGLERLIAKYAVGSIEDRYRKLIDTGINDARSMLTARPRESASAVRFLSLLLYKFVFAGDPLEKLKNSERFEDDDFDAIFESKPPREYDHHQAVAQFFVYVKELTDRVNRQLDAERNPTIGTTRLMGHILGSYDAGHLLPLNSRTSIYESLDTVATWLDDVAGSTKLAGEIGAT